MSIVLRWMQWKAPGFEQVRQRKLEWGPAQPITAMLRLKKGKSSAESCGSMN
jgi:hypothetical protein